MILTNFEAMKRSQYIVGLFVMLLVAACARVPQQASKEVLQEAQCRYDSGFLLFENKELMEAFPYFIQVAEKLEVLPEDMNPEEKRLTSQAYYRIGLVFKNKMETNAEIEALKRALCYQQMVNDSSLVLRSSLTLARAFSVIKESDSARYYLDLVVPLIDTVSGDLVDYYSAQLLLSDLYYDQHKFDSCFMVQQELIAFKTRRGIDAKNDSVSLGIAMFHSPQILRSKPYLLKVLETDLGELERSAIMSLLARIYEYEGNADSVAFCQSFHTTYVQAESDRVSDGMLAVKQYERFKAERDARLQALREAKAAQKAKTKSLIGLMAAVFAVIVVTWVLLAKRKRHLNVLRDKDQEALQIKVDAIYNDRHGKKGQRILEAFNAAYPEALVKLKAQYPDLSETEIDICVLSYFPFRMKEIADILDLRENTVSKYRTVIKKKTQTNSFEALWKALMG